MTKFKSVFGEDKSFHNFCFKDLKHLKPTRQKWGEDCHLYGCFMEKTYLELSLLTSFPLRTFQMSSLYLNSFTMSVNISIMTALCSILQVINKNKTKRMNKEGRK